MPLKRILTVVVQAIRERKRRRARALADEVAEALDDLRAVGRKALIQEGRRYHPRPNWSSRLRIIGFVLAQRRTRLYLLIASTIITTTWLLVGERCGPK